MSLQVCEGKCNQCLFTPQRIVSGARMKNILKECRQKDIHFVCHKASIAGRDVCCRGFYETQTSQMIRIAQRLNMIEFVDPATDKPAAQGPTIQDAQAKQGEP